MKRLLLLLPALLLIMSACEKEKKENLTVTCPAAFTWMGDWQLSSYWNSPGAGPVVWSPATEKTTISFNNNSTFSSSKTNWDRFRIYGTAAGNAVAFYKQGSTDTAYFEIQFSPDTLTLFNLGCIEGCAEKYVRSKTTQY